MIGIGTGFEDLSEERSYSLSNYTKGALLYMICDHVVRPAELPRSQYPNIEPGCVTCVPYKGPHPLRRFAAILAQIGNKHGSDEPYLFPISFIKTTIEGGLFYVSI